MKIIKRLVVLQLLFLFIIPIAFGEISITLPEKELYNLGEKIVPTVSIKEDQNYDGFFSLSIICDDYNMDYYKIPLSLEEGFRTQLSVPDLLLFKDMNGECRLKANFENTNGENIDTAESKDFVVTNELGVIVDENLEAKLGEDVIISGEVKKHSNEVFSKGEATISFMDEEDKIEIISGKFEHTIHLSDDIEAGYSPILITVRDSYDNYGDKLLNLGVIPIPKAIENVIMEDVLISDNRSAPKKITGAVSVVTGAVVSTVGYITSRPILAAVILSLIVIGTVARYSKDFIINKIKGKKDNTENLFEDFKFEEKK